jgi:hypothetical protein
LSYYKLFDNINKKEKVMSTKEIIDMFKSVYEMIKLHKTYTELLEKRIVLLEKANKRD